MEAKRLFAKLNLAAFLTVQLYANTAHTGGFFAAYVPPMESAHAQNVGAQMSIDVNGPAQIEPNQKVSFQVTARNDGDETATNVRVIDWMHQKEHFTFLPDKSSDDCSLQNNGNVKCGPFDYDPGEERQFTISFQASETCGDHCGAVVTNQGDVHYDNGPSDWDKHMSTIHCGEPDMEVEKTGPAEIVAGDKVTYTITARNNGTGPALNARVVDWIHGNKMSLIEAESSPQCHQSGNKLECGPYDYAAGEVRTFTAVFQSQENEYCGEQIINQVDVHLDNGASDWDKVMSTMLCPNPELTLEKTGPATILTEGTASYTLTVQNIGDGTAHDVVIVDDLRNEGFTFNAAQSSNDCNADATEGVVCGFWDLAPGASKTVTIAWDTPQDLTCGGTITNEAAAHATDANSDWDSATSDVECREPDMTVEKTGPATIVAGDKVTYTITATNHGDGTALNARVVDWIHGNKMTLLAAESTAGCTQNGNKLTCGPHDYAPGQTRVFTIVFQSEEGQYCGEQIINQVDVHLDNGESDWDKVMSDIECRFPDMEVEKTGPATIVAGDKVTYTITATNHGDGTAKNARVVDWIHNNKLTLIEAESSAECFKDGQKLRCGPFDYAPGQSRTFTAVFQSAENEYCGEQVINQVDVHLDNGESDWDKVMSDIECRFPDMEVEKTGPATIVAGDKVTYTITATNHGNGTAKNATVTDWVHGNKLDLIAAESSAECSQNGNKLECGPFDYAPGQSRTFTIVFQSTEGEYCGEQIINQVDVHLDNGESDWDKVMSDVHCPRSDVKVLKDGPATVSRGGVISYTVTARNLGPDTAEDVYVTDEIPAGLTYITNQNSSECNSNGTSVVCGPETLGPNQDKSYTLNFQVPQNAACETEYVNVATVESSTQDDYLDNNESGEVVTELACTPPEYEMEKIGPATIGPDEVITYTIRVKNTGEATAEDLIVEDLQQAGLSFLPAQSSNECSKVGNAVICGPFDLTENEERFFTLAFHVSEDRACDSEIHNLADLIDGNNGVAWGKAITTVVCPDPEADLEVQKDGPAEVLNNEFISYTITATNYGPDTAEQVAVTDNVPNGLSFVENQSSNECDLSGNTVICDGFDLEADESKTLVLTFEAEETLACDSTVYNDATIHSVTTDPDGSNNHSDTVTTVVHCPIPEADLFVEKDGPASVLRGDTFEYTMTVTNAGPDTAENVVVTDQLPADVTFNAAESDAECAVDGNNVVTCALGDLVADGVVGVTIAVDVTNNAAVCEETLYNTASVASETLDPNNANNISNEVETYVECLYPEIDIEKTGPATIVAGEKVTYTITVTNNGEGVAENVRAIDWIHGGHFTYLPAESSAECTLKNNGRVKCGPFDYAAGENRTFTLVFQTEEDQLCEEQVINQADAHLDNGQSDWAKVMSTVECPQPEADLVIEKDGPATALTGSTIIYTVTATNLGPDTAENVVVTDTVPAGLAYNAAESSAACTLDGNTVVCDGFDLAANESKSFTIAMNVTQQAQCSASVHNTAVVSSDAVELNEQDNTSNTVSTFIECPTPDMNVEKTGPATITAGEKVTYTITATNNGTGTGKNVLLIDTVLNNKLTFVEEDSSVDCVLNGNQVECGPSDYAPGESKSFTLVFQSTARAYCDESIMNQVDLYVSNGEGDWDKVVSPVLCPDPEADVEVQKDGPASVVRGNKIQYQVTAINNGPDAATGVVITDVIPAGLTYDLTNSTNGCVQQGSDIVCQSVDLANGESHTVTLAFNVPMSVKCDSSLYNEASATSQVLDPNEANNTDSATSVVECPTGYQIQKTGPATVLPGNLISYTITATNNSPTDLEDLWIIDKLQAGLTFVPNLSSSACSQSGNEVQCGPFDLVVAQSQSYVVVFEVSEQRACDSVITNTADLVKDNVNLAWGKATTDVICPADPEADVEIQKDGPATVLEGSTIYYNVTVKNNGPEKAENVVVTDQVPGGLTYNATESTAACSESNGTVSCDAITLLDNQSATYRLAFDLDPALQCTKTLVNEAVVTTSTLDPNSANNSDTAQTNVVCMPDPEFEISKTDGRTTVKAGEELTYTITVKNDSVATATGVTVSDTLPPETQFVSADTGYVLALPNGFGSAYVAWPDLTFAPGETKVFHVTVRVDLTAEDGTVLRNEAEVEDKIAIDTTTVVEEVIYGCIDVIKETYNTEGAILTPVTQFTFHLDGNGATVFNTSDGRARFENVTVGEHTVTEVIPQGWEQVSVAPTNGVVQVVAGDECSTVTFKNQQEEVETQDPEFSISKTDGRTTVERNEVLTYTITVTNTGNADADDRDVVDVVPSELIIQSASSGSSINGQVVTWADVDFDAGETKTFTVKAKVKSTTEDGHVLLNTVSIANKTATDTTTVEVDDDEEEEGDITIVSISDTPDPLLVPCEDIIEYRIRLRNNGDLGKRTDVVAQLDDGMRFADASDDPEVDHEEVTWEDFFVGGNDTEDLRISVRIDEYDVHNSVQLRVTTDDDSDTETTTIDVTPSCGGGGGHPPATGVGIVTIDKEADRSEVQPGSVVSYTLTLRNLSDAPAEGIVIEDQFVSGIVDVQDSGGAYNHGNGLGWEIPYLAPLETRVIQYRVRVSEAMRHGQIIENQVAVHGFGFDRIATDSAYVNVIEYLPQTGATSFSGAVGEANEHVRLVESKNEEDNSFLITMWTMILSMGAAVGGAVKGAF